ncbi:alpha/beta hydrolase [Sphingomonas morindae]|uniref:Alpha/beta hydrolase n=1 Tax=Sphingomonas morindae TaxID=1541170 RepID=A0ABY4X5F7_9SPHN|nr:alpha/beta hydrolase [Sphingomonas morindae]USI72163.1 alpha/beta hydrolase [Sphingomonas morindae]
MPGAELRPDVATFLGYLNALPGPRIWEVSAPEARAMTLAMRGVADLETGPLAVMRDLEMPGIAGPIRLRLYDARIERAPGPVILFYHGGGWVLGDLDGYDPPCAEMARRLDLPVISVDYRLAPEHPWPAGPDDCEAAARWVATAPEALGLRPTDLLLAGDSAGGNLAIVTAMALRDEPAALPVRAHWAIYPATDLGRRYPSHAAFARDYFLTHEGIQWFADSYAPDPGHWRASPLAGDLAGLSPALITTAGLDPLRDQGRAYAAGLAQAGVAVSYREAAGTIHGFINLRKAIPSAQQDFHAHLATFGALIAELRP